MPTIRSFEDLNAWKFARELSREIYAICRKPKFSKDFALKDQIIRSSGSIMDNIAEGFSRGGKREFIQFLSIAKSSAAEVKSQLYRALDQDYISRPLFNLLYTKIENIEKTIYGLMNYLAKSEYKGIKFKS